MLFLNFKSLFQFLVMLVLSSNGFFRSWMMILLLSNLNGSLSLVMMVVLNFNGLFPFLMMIWSLSFEMVSLTLL